RRTRPTGFNGAATIWSRKPTGGGVCVMEELALQWGRDHLVAETRELHTCSDPRCTLQWGRDHLVAETSGNKKNLARDGRELQWGRDHLVAETKRHSGRGDRRVPGFNGAATIWSRKHVGDRRVRARVETASMGPRPSGRGNTVTGTGTGTALKASMGPRPSGRGNQRGGRRWLAGAGASMGPRPSGRGNRHRRRGRRALPEGASMGPRPSGRGNRITSTRPEAGAMLQWGRDHLVAETPPRGPGGEPTGSFNGAATIWSRKLTLRAWSLSSSSRFNGAATIWSRKPARLGGRAGLLAALQWGRDHLVAETSDSCTRRSASGRFNGAATIWSRKPVKNGLLSDASRVLQWGRDHLVAETGASSLDVLRAAVLQWGRDHLVAETSTGLALGNQTHDVASMGPRPSGRGNPGPCTASRWCWTRFNGAATIWSRKQHRRRPMARSPKAS